MTVTKKILSQYDVKQCTLCREEKPLDKFYRNCRSKDGHSSRCKDCIDKQQREYGKEHAKEIYARRKEYVLNYNREHREERNAYNRMWRAKNKDRIKQRRYEEGVRYRAKYKDEIRERKQFYENKRRTYDPMFKLKGQVRIMIRDSFRRKGLKKSDNTERILGCSLVEFQRYLLQTWEERYGSVWNGEDCHIDHIVPLATAKTEEDIIRLCHYTNLQLLTPLDNFKKGGRYEYLKNY